MRNYESIENLNEIKMIGIENIKLKCIKLIDNIEK